MIQIMCSFSLIRRITDISQLDCAGAVTTDVAALIDQNNFDENLSGLISGDSASSAFFGNVATDFHLSFKTGSNQPDWESWVVFNPVSTSGGGYEHRVLLSENQSNLFVWGASNIHAPYFAVFSKKDGACIAQFSAHIEF